MTNFYKRYIYKNGVKHGPYYYSNKKVDGKVISTYLGTSPPTSKEFKKPSKFKSKVSVKFLIILLSLVSIGLFVYLSINLNLFSTGQPIRVPEATSIIGSLEGEEVSINDTNISKPRVSPNTQEVSTIQGSAVVGQPVIWEKEIILENKGPTLVLVPNYAENIVVYKITEEGEQEKVSDTSLKITARVSAEIELDNESSAITKFFKKIIDFFKGLFTGKVVDIQSRQNLKQVFINENSNHYVIEYSTPAPTITEQETESGKIITVSSQEPTSYENVLVSTDLNEELNIQNPESVKIHWIEQDQYLNPDKVDDTDSNGIYDSIEFTAPLSNQTYEIIVIVKAEHLDSNKVFISDIYSEVKELDCIWSETINDGEYVRVTFEQKLTSENDITIYPRTISGSPKIEVYEKDKDVLIVEFTNILDNEYNQVLLTNLQGEQDNFDLKIVGGSVEFNHIIDPVMRVKAGITSSGSSGTGSILFASSMSSAAYSILLSGGTDTDTMYSISYLNKTAAGFSIKAEDDTGSNEAGTNIQWIAIEYGDFNFTNNIIKCALSSGAAGNNIVTFASAFPNTNYAIIADSIDDSDSPNVNFVSGSKQVGQATIRIEDDSGATEAVTQTNYCTFTIGEYLINNLNFKAGSSITASSGDTTITFGVSFPSTNYVVVAMAQAVTGALCAPEVVTKSTGSFIIHFEDDVGANCASRNFDWVAIQTGEFFLDTDPPAILNPNTNTSSVIVNNYFCLNATATDSSGVSQVLAQVYNTTAWLNYTMAEIGPIGSTCMGSAGDDVYGVEINGSAVGIWNYSKVFANDSLNNLGELDFGDLTINVTSPGNSPPSIGVVGPVPPTMPIENSTVPINFIVQVSDPNGYADISNLSVNFTYPAEPVRSGSCIFQNGAGNNANYSCTVYMQYYDIGDTWNVNVTARDLKGDLGINNTAIFTYGQLRAIVITSPSGALSWPTLESESVNVSSDNDPSIIENLGNVEATQVWITGYDLAGETDPQEKLNVSKFRAGGILGGECVVGISSRQLQNATPIWITSVILHRGEGSTAPIYYCITEVPSISSQNYSATGANAWIIQI
jgi:hypothetical protein